MHQRIEDQEGQDRELFRMALVEKRQEVLAILGAEPIRQDQLRQVEEALERLDGGEFGRCQCCGQSIASLRLQAIPWARYCVICQCCVTSTGEEPEHRRAPKTAGSQTVESGL
jgi:RNA polymerase-binding transcription factor DksA